MANSSTTKTAMWGVMAGSWLGTLVEFMYENPTAIATMASCSVPEYPSASGYATGTAAGRWR